MRGSARWCSVIALAVSSTMSQGQVGAEQRGMEPVRPAPSAEAIAFFEKKIRPVLVAECYACHSREKTNNKVRGGLALDTREGLQKGGENGRVVVPGRPDQSPLIQALAHGDPLTAMPPKKKLGAEVVRDFEEWVKAGAVDPRESGDPLAVSGRPQRNHWSFQSPKRAAVPSVRQADWPKSDVDRFILASLEAKGLTPTADADRRILLRRVTLDLTGLPPTPEAVTAFLADRSPDALEKVVDRLSSSFEFAERWARHWLDVARYAESTGKTVNFYYPHAWRYRDYVIQAFHNDKPYDQFILEQLAGDLMPTDRPKERSERLIATGFLAVGPKVLNDRSGLKFELDVVDEQIDVTTQAFLGITVACARCHDHKFDPIPQVDYYALAGIFRSTETCYGTVRYINAQRQAPLLSLAKESEPAVAVPLLTDADRQNIESRMKSVRDSMRTSKDGLQQFFASGQLSLLQARLDAYDSDGNPKLLAMGVRDRPKTAVPGGGRTPGFAGFTYDGTRVISDSPVYVRGESDQPSKDRIARGSLQVLTKTPLMIPPGTSGRLELARWIADRQNPLTARVMVNRVWRHLFGRGLVPTADDFGAAGRPPSHPELLDHLAHYFMDNGWSVKKLIKYVVMSRVYGIDSAVPKDHRDVDPDNFLLRRMNTRRLDAESLRDSLLAVGGLLNLSPPVGSAVARAGEGPVNQPGPGGGSVLSAVNDPRNSHRSIYLPIIRENLPESLALFDAADPSLITSDRATTTVPSQGLFMLNNPLVIRAADGLADQLLKGTGTDAERIRTAYRRCLGREPTIAEIAAAERFLKRFREQPTGTRSASQATERETWSSFAQAMFAGAEFLYRR